MLVVEARGKRRSEGPHRESAAAVGAETNGAVKIRRAKISDAERIAKLSGQLGYAATTADVVRRFRTIKPASQHAVFVAQTVGGEVIGWTHISVQPLLELDLRAELNALIVADEQRSRGAGALLLQAAEDWAYVRGCQHLSVRSNVLRERAHQFYLRNGYEHYKTQKAFRKLL
jgi:GNAT superfamily N-acetyltransferase